MHDTGLSEEFETEQQIPDDLKGAINHFLYPNLPDSMTLKEFEDITVAVFKLVIEAWDVSRLKDSK